MKLLEHKLQSIPYAISHISKTITNTSSPFEMITEAPKWLQIVSRGSYCAYKNTIYVPAIHLELVSSKFDSDRDLATAKLLPWIMLLHDEKNISAITAVKALFNVSYQIHYFLYEFLFLKATQHRFYDLISVGFMTTRRSFFGIKKLSYEQIEAHMKAIINNSIPKK